MTTLVAAPARIDARTRLGDFFHRPEVPYGLALMRIALPLVLLVPMAYRWPYSRELFSSDGAAVSLWTIGGWPTMLPEPSGAIAVAINGLLVLALVTSSLGWCTRVSLVAATISYLYLNTLDIIGTLNKSSIIAVHLMFCLCFSHCGSLWSVDSWLERSRRRREWPEYEWSELPRRYSAWPRRVIQFFLGFVYLGAAMTKIQIPSFFTGEQLQTWMITTYHAPNLLGNWLALHPSLVVICAHITAIWEILFIFLAWRRGWRRAILGLGVVFHVMTWLVLGLIVFPLICLSAYFAFLDESDMHALSQRLSGWREAGTGVRGFVGRMLRAREAWAGSVPSPAWSGGILAGLAAIVVVGGVGLEQKLDRYGLRRPEGPYPLQEVDIADVREMIAPTKRIANEDMVLNFDVGSVVMAGAVLDRRTQFRQGDRLWAQCGLVPPHESMWIECSLHDSEDRLVDSVGQFVASENLRTMFYYNFGDCILPGDYSLVLKIAGEEILRRPISILSRTKACAAN